MGVIFEHPPTLTEHVYEGKAVFMPIPTSYDPTTKLQPAYAVQCSAEDAANLPALTENEHVKIEVLPNAINSNNDQKWNGNVSELSGRTPLKAINISSRPPLDNKMDTSKDDQQLIAPKDLPNTVSSRQQKWVFDNRRIPVRLTHKCTKELV